MKAFRLLCVAVFSLIIGLAASAWSAEPPAGAQTGPKKAEFEKTFAQWKTLLNDLRNLRDEYRKASAEKRPEIETRYNGLLEKGQELQPKVLEAAKDAYREDPKSAKDAAEFVLASLFFRCQSDAFEEALSLGKFMLDNHCDDLGLHGWAGVAAFCTGDFVLAETELKLAAAANVFEKMGDEFAQLGPMMLAEIPFYKQAGQKEEQLRAAEAKANDLPRVLLKTSKGDIEVELFENEAPNTVANFISLVEKGFYNGTPFHRVLPMFMAQGGDPTGTGKGGPAYTIPCECYRPDARVHFRGTLSMAHAGRDTGGSQFFLTFRPTHHLDGKHTVFGRVVKGMDVLAKIQRRDPERPEGPQPDKIDEAKVLRKRNHPYEVKKTAKATGPDLKQ
jgi:cyclophilin family peptidyl-prolyl cis-trans isomerase